MPFLNQRQIASNLRSQSEKDYKAQLRSALQNPGLSAEQRRDIQERLSRVGQPKVYDPNSPPIPGAIELPKATPVPVVEYETMTKAELQALAAQRGLLTTGGRAVLIQRLKAG